MTVGRSVSEKSDRTTWHSEWMLHHEKFSEKSDLAFSSWNWTWEGVESEEDALERKGFWDEVDFRLGATEQLTERGRERERERERRRKAPTQINIKIKINEGTYAWKMHEHVICKLKNIMGSTQSKPTSTHHCNKVNTHLKCMKHCYNANVMQCMMF